MYINRLILIGVVVMFASCAEIDDLEPVTEINADTAFTTEENVVASLNAAYDPLQWQSVLGQNTFPLLSQGVRADDLHSQSASFWAIGAQWDQFSTIVPSLPSVAALWSKWYRAVGRANFTIELAGNFDNYTTDGLQQQIIGEARFLRGLYYFELVRLWGGVPLFEEPITSSEQEIFKARSTAAEVYAFIEADLQAAADLLPEKGAERVQGSATSGAALGLLTKVYLYQQKWPEAVASAEQVINQGVYRLEEDFRNNFLQTTEFGPESLFEINYQDGLFAGGFVNTNQQQEGSAMWRWSFPFLSGTYPSFNNFIPRQDLVDFFDDSDQRKEATFLLPGQVLNSPGLATLGFDPVPDNFGYAIGVNTGAKKYFLTFEEVQELLNVEGSPLNEKILRYAEVLLMHAEASLMGGGGNGQASFQQVIDRAYGSGNPAAPSYTLQGVRDERRRELTTEGWNRFTDLVRWEILDGGGVIGPALQAIGKTDFSSPRDLLLPIPQQEIDIYPEGLLEQNPGY